MTHPERTLVDARDLRERLERHARTMQGSLAAEQVAATMREAAAALEKVEALEAALADTTRHLGLYVQDDGHETNGPAGWVNDADPAAWDAFDRAHALLSTPAPAGEKEGEDGR